MRCLIFLMALLAGNVQSQSPRGEANHAENSAKANQQSRADSRSAPEAFSSNLASKMRAAEPDQDAEDCRDEGSEFWSIGGRCLKITDSLLVVFTALLFAATVFLYLATRNLVVGAQDTAKRQLRAYVAVAAHDGPRLQSDKPISVSVQLTNLGQTPAHHVTSWMSINVQPF